MITTSQCLLQKVALILLSNESHMSHRGAGLCYYVLGWHFPENLTADHRVVNRISRLRSTVWSDLKSVREKFTDSPYKFVPYLTTVF